MAIKNRSKIKTVLEETGFGSKSFSDLDRLIKKDGSFNVTKKGGGLKQFSLYYTLIQLHWLLLLFYGILAYVSINLLFAFGYYLGGPEQLSSNNAHANPQQLFIHCFYFSTQTLTTVGFGHISPRTNYSSILAAIEAMIGLLSFAFATSIIYGRFSKAKAKILFSNEMVISPYQSIKGLKFRIANPGKNKIIELKARLIYSYLKEENGRKIRKYTPLPLEIDFINMFPLPWTIVHPIDKGSLLAQTQKSELVKAQAEFIVLLKGYDDAFNQDIHQIYSYRANEILFDHDFIPMFDTGFEKSTEIRLDLISKTKKL